MNWVGNMNTCHSQRPAPFCSLTPGLHSGGFLGHQQYTPWSLKWTERVGVTYKIRPGWLLTAAVIGYLKLCWMFSFNAIFILSLPNYFTVCFFSILYTPRYTALSSTIIDSKFTQSYTSGGDYFAEHHLNIDQWPFSVTVQTPLVQHRELIGIRYLAQGHFDS